MLELRCIFTLVSFLILERSTNYVVSMMAIEDDNIRTAESAIRTTANTLFYILGVRKIQQNPRLHHYAVVHNYFISKTLQNYENLKEIVKLTNVDKSNKTNNSTDFIALINKILNEDNVLKLQNIIMGEGGRTGYDIESEMAKLNYLKKYHAEQSKIKVERNEDSLKPQNASLEWENITNSSENGDNVDAKPFWSEDNILPERRIFNGKRTKIKKFPFMASIQIFGKFQCAGSIIRSDLIITAASCLQLAWNNRFYRENPSFLTVRVGSSFYEIGGEHIEVLQIYFYPSYDPKLLRHNIAILRLVRNIKMKRGKVQMIEVADSYGDNSGKVLVVGWGAYAIEDKLHGVWEDKIRSSALDNYPLEECQDIYSTDYVTQQNFCAGFMSVGGGACNRDVGGPGIISGQLAGVISFGAPQCGKPDSPTVFTKLSVYTDWIEEIMEQDVEWINKRTTLKPLGYIKHQNSQTVESDENTDIYVTAYTSQRPSLAVTSSIYSPPVIDIEQDVMILNDSDEKKNQLTEIHTDSPKEIHTVREQLEITQQQHPEVNIEKNDTKDEELLNENGNFTDEAHTENMIKSLRSPVMDYKDVITKKEYEFKNDPSQKQTTSNYHKHSEILLHNIERSFIKKLKNTSNNDKQRYTQGYFENATNYSNFTGKADTENMIESLRSTAMDYRDIFTKEGYESEEQITDNYHKHSEILPHSTKMTFNKKLTNTSNKDKPRYTQGYFEKVTNYSNINKSIHPEIINDTQDEAVTKNITKLELYNPEDIEKTTSIFDFTLNLEKKHESLYPEVMMLNNTEQSHKKHFIKIKAQTLQLQIVGNTQFQTIEPSNLISDDIQTTTPINLMETPPLFENRQALYQITYTGHPTFTQMNFKLDTSNKKSTESQEADKAAYLESLIETQETVQKLPMSYQEEIKMAYQNIRKRQEEEEKLVDLIAYQLLLSQSEEEASVQNKKLLKQVPEPVKIGKRANRTRYSKFPTNRGRLTQVQTREEDNLAHNSQAGEKSPQDEEINEMDNGPNHLLAEKKGNIDSQQAAENTNITKHEHEDKSENQKNYAVTKEDLSIENQELSTQGYKESKLYVQTDSTPTIKSVNSVNSNVQIRAKDIEKHDNQTIYMQVDEDFNSANSESLIEDYEEDNPDHQISIPTNEDRNMVNFEPLKKNFEQHNYQTYSTLVDKDKTYKKQPTYYVEKEVHSYDQADSILADEITNIVNSESVKRDQTRDKLDNQLDFIISDQNMNLKNQKSPIQVPEIVRLEKTNDDRENSHKLKKDKILKAANDSFFIQTQESSNYVYKKRKPPIKCISNYCQNDKNLTHTEDISQQLNVKQKNKIEYEIKLMGKTVSTKVLRNNVLAKKIAFKHVLQNQLETSSLKPSLIPPTLPLRDFSASSHKSISNFKDLLGLMQKETLVQRSEQGLSKITNEMNAEMKKFLENNLDKAVLSLLNPPDVQGSENDFSKHINRNVTILPDYGDIVGKTATSENPGHPIKEHINDEIMNMKKQKEEILETINKRNRQRSETKQPQMQFFEVPPIDEKEIEILLPLFTTSGKVKTSNQKQNSMYLKNVSDESYYNMESSEKEKESLEKVSKETRNVEIARRAMHLFNQNNHLESIELREDNTTEVNIKMDSEEEETIKRNILDYINVD